MKIEFNGRLSGVAEKWFYKRTKDLGRFLTIWLACLVLPTMVIFFRLFTVIVSLFGALVIYLATYIPYSKKEKEKIVPRRIYILNDCITSQANQTVETRYINDVKVVKDYGEFYELVFPFGKVSYGFICQKDLLVTGTLEDFERLFEGKIERK